MDNLYDTTKIDTKKGEVFETVLEAGEMRIERIVTQTPYSEPGEWYDQEQDEWVVLLKGSAILEFKSGGKTKLSPGDHLFIPSNKVHRVSWSSPGEVCIWLAIHGKFK
jgi:cupin 2 domain-containing protein